MSRPGQVFSSERFAILTEASEKLRDIEKTFSVDDRSLVDLVYYEGETIAEAARKLNIRKSVARYKLRKVLERLRKELLVSADEALALVENFDWSSGRVRGKKRN